MKRKVLPMILLLSFLISSTACQGSKVSSGEVVKPDAKGVPELNIILMPGMENWEKQDYFADYKKDFEKKYGVKVNYIKITNFEEGGKQLMTKLSVKNGPELVMDAYDSPKLMIDSGAAVDLKGKVPNVDKMYSSFREKEVYFAPYGIIVWPTVLRKDMLEELQIPGPDFAWTQEDYYNMYDKWVDQSQRLFTQYEFYQITNRYLSKMQLFDFQSKKANINTDEMKNTLKNIRKEIYSGKYKLNEDYSYKNYYNMLFEGTSEEYTYYQKLRRSKEYLNQSLIDRGEESDINMLLPNDIDLKSNRFIVRPSYLYKNIILSAFGFVVNKNGANKELAYEFINGMLSDEVQMQMITPKSEGYYHIYLYPVNGAIENKINDMDRQKDYSEEALQLKQYVLQRIKNGEYEIIALRDNKKGEHYGMIVKDLLPFIFADKEYSDAELSKELQKIEDKFNIYLSE